jgi:WD40 repeat protein
MRFAGTTVMPDSLPILNYGRAPRSRKKFVLWIAFILAIAAIWFVVAPPVSRYIDHLVAVHRYMGAQAAACIYTMDPSVVCYTDDPALIATLAGNSNYGPLGYTADRQLIHHVSDLEDASLSEFAGSPQMYGTEGPATPLFVHQRRSPAGHERLVSISLWSGGPLPDTTIDLCLRIDVFTLANSAAAASAASSNMMHLNHGIADHRLTLFAGQSDPANRSHFTIPIDFRGARRVIDGYLRDDDTVLLDPHLGYVVSPISGRQTESFDMDSFAPNTVAITTPTFKLAGGHPLPSPYWPTYRCCAFSPDATLLAVAMEEPAKPGDNSRFGPARLCLLDAITGRTLRELQISQPADSYGDSITFSPDGTLLAVMETYTGIRLWNVATARQIGVCAAGDIHDFSLMRFDAEGKQFVATNKNTEYIFSLPALNLLRTEPVPPLKAASVSFQPPNFYLGGGKSFPTYRDDRTTPAPGQYCIADNNQSFQFQPPGAASGISPDGHWYAWPNGAVSVVDLQTQSVCIQRTIRDPPWNSGQKFISATFSPDGRLLASCADWRGLSLWRMPDCDLLYDIQIQPGTRITFFTISPDDKHVATIDVDDNLNVWDLPAPPATGG